jgi:hypothetical protein
MFGPDLLLRRSVCVAGQPAYPQVNRGTGLSVSDREFPALTDRSGTRRSRSRLRRRQTTSFEFVHLACLDSVAHLPSDRDHSAHIPDHGYFRRD